MKFEDVKKDQVIYEIAPYNFQFFNEVRGTVYDRELCRHVPTDTDEAFVLMYRVHSIGKKLMRLMDPATGETRGASRNRVAGVCSKDSFEFRSWKGGVENHLPKYFATKEDAVTGLMQNWLGGDHRRHRLKIYYAVGSDFNKDNLLMETDQ